MIFNGENKAKMLFVRGKRVYFLCLGEKVIYNCYAIPEHEVVFIDSNGEAWQNVYSNTQWEQV